MDVFDLVAKLSLDSSGFEGGLGKAEETAKNSKLGSTMAGVAKTAGASLVALGTATVTASKAFVSNATQVAEYGDEIDKMSQKLGISAETYQEYDYVLNLAGTSMSDMTVGMKTLTNQLQNAKDGSKGAIEAFQKLGISEAELSTLSREDLFKKTIAGMQAMEDSADRASLANDLFGKSGQNLTPLFNQSAEDTQKLIDNLNEMGSVMSGDAIKSSADFKDSLTTMQTAFDGLKNNMMANFLPSLTTITNGITDLVTGKEGAGEAITKGIDSLVDGIAEKMPQIMDALSTVMGAIVESAPTFLGAFAEGIISALPTILPKMMEFVSKFGDSLVELLPELAKTAVSIVTTIAEGISKNLPVLIPAMVEMIFEIGEGLLDNIDMLIDVAIELVIGLTDGIMNAMPILIEKTPEIILKLAMALIENAPRLVLTAVELVGKLIEGFLQAIPQIAKAGEDLVNGLWNGIKENWDSLVQKAGGLAQKLIDKVKGVFGIHSPSKVFGEIGAFCVDGFNNSFDELGNPDVIKAGLDKAVNAMNDVDANIGLNAYGTPATEANRSDNITIMLNGDVDKIFDAMILKNNEYMRANGGGAFA